MSQRRKGDLSDRATAETIKFMKKGLHETETVSRLVSHPIKLGRVILIAKMIL